MQDCVEFPPAIENAHRRSVNFCIEHFRCLLDSAREEFCRLKGSKFRARDPWESCISLKTKGIDKVARFLQS